MNMPTDQLCGQIAIAVRGIRQNTPQGTKVENGRLLRVNLEEYFSQTLHPQLCANFPNLDDIVLGVVGLMAYLGPLGAPFPPAPLRDELIELARNYTNALPHREPLGLEVELAIAYGGLWKREARCGNRRWDEHWTGAVQELIDTARNFIVRTIRQLDYLIEDFTPPYENVLRDYSNDIVGEFTGALFPTSSARYKQYHTIRMWDPAKGNLYNYLNMAIRGGKQPNNRLQTNRFNQGLLFKCLQDDKLLDAADIAMQKCVQCDYKEEYDASSICPLCEADLFVRAEPLLFVPLLSDGEKSLLVYRGLDFYRRTEIGNHYHRPREDCSICRGIEPSQRPNPLMVRS